MIDGELRIDDRRLGSMSRIDDRWLGSMARIDDRRLGSMIDRWLGSTIDDRRSTIDGWDRRSIERSMARIDDRRLGSMIDRTIDG